MPNSPSGPSACAQDIPGMNSEAQRRAVAYAVQACPLFMLSQHANATNGPTARCVTCGKLQHQHWLRQLLAWRDGDYPSDAALERLRTWPAIDVNGALDFMAALWHFDSCVSRELQPHEALMVHAEPGDRFLRLATGGWSGNESLISAFDGWGDDDKRCVEGFLRCRTWKLSTCGGLHIYQYTDAEPGGR